MELLFLGERFRALNHGKPALMQQTVCAFYLTLMALTCGLAVLGGLMPSSMAVLAAATEFPEQFGLCLDQHEFCAVTCMSPVLLKPCSWLLQHLFMPPVKVSFGAQDMT